MQNGFCEFQILWNCLSLQYSALSFPQAQLALSSVRLLNWIQRKFRSCLAPKGKVDLWCTDIQTVNVQNDHNVQNVQNYHNVWNAIYAIHSRNVQNAHDTPNDNNVPNAQNV